MTTSATATPIPNRGPQSSWLSAEQEKSRLYDDARSRAAAAQQSTGASLQDLGLDEPTVAPPEYAPPRPALPQQEYTPPTRPVSVFTARPASLSAGVNRQEPVAEHPEPPPPPKPSSIDQTYVSAAEEKEEQRRRFEEAQGRVASGSSARQSVSKDPPSSDGPIPYDQIFPAGPSVATTQPVGSSSTLAPVHQPPTGALSDKEQMRRFYEAQDRVAAASGSGGSNVHSNNLSSPIRNGASGSSQASRPVSIPAGLGISGGPPMSGLSGKEQMRRFYEAQDRVARATGSVNGSPMQPDRSSVPTYDSPPSIEAPSTPASSSNAAAGFSRSQTAYMSAEEEKEMMRRRFEEAQAAVERRQRSVSPPLVGAGSSQAGTSTSGPPTGTGYLSAEQEKEMMRKRFEEAQAAVERKQRGVSPPLVEASGSSTQAGPSTSKPPAGTGYLSAEQEKEMMKKRFEEAQAAVERRQRSVSPPPFGASGSSAQAGPSNPIPPPGAGYMSAEEEKEMMRKRFEDAQAAVERQKKLSSPRPSYSPQRLSYSSSRPSSPPESPDIRRDPTIRAGKARARVSGEPVGPPPPLPSKPPREYIDLLSPLQESGPSFARLP